ncbi:unnamed protein product [Paramecium sonneborni]|uniref:Uncharacterized protein n=1 Tax=Paramecium sonneborni TaxID=65129 RepID=A0A8S1M5K0_9CILI|nr:unnamed protein product [Paramecium sonneborni]
MKQQRDSLFFQCQLYVAELSEPLTILQFLGDDEFESQKQSNHHDKLEISNKSEKKENSNKIYSTQRYKEKSLWIKLGEQSIRKAIRCSFIVDYIKNRPQMGYKKIKAC